jgi:hypothetical protein
MRRGGGNAGGCALEAAVSAGFLGFMRSREMQFIRTVFIQTSYAQIDPGKGTTPPLESTLNQTPINQVIAYIRELGNKHATTTQQ